MSFTASHPANTAAFATPSSTSASARRIPAVAARLLAHLPRYPGSVLFVAGLNLALARHLHPDTLDMLEGRSLRIHVRDAGLRFDYTWHGRVFEAAQHGESEPDLTIGASAMDFYRMIQRREDPDTLFFSRRLIMEGDTELGLMVKNTLDAIDMAAFHPRRLLSDILRGLRPAGRSGMV